MGRCYCRPPPNKGLPPQVLRRFSKLTGTSASVCVGRTLSRGEDLLDCLQIVLRLAERWHTAVALNVPRSGVVAGKRQVEIALVIVEEALEIPHTAHDVL